MAYGSGFFKTSYEADMAVLDSGVRRIALAMLVIGLLVLPRVASAFVLELLSQAALAAVGALALNVLTGMAGQVSLGHAGFLAAGAFTVGVLVEGWKAGPLVTFPAAAIVGAVLGLAVGAPSLRLKGLYLALGTLAMHFVVLYLGSEYQARWGLNTGVSVPPIVVFGARLRTGVQWYYALIALAALATVVSLNLSRSRVGRAWMAIRDREVAAASLGIAVARYKLLAFVVAGTIAGVAGALYVQLVGSITPDAFLWTTSGEALLMVIIGGTGTLGGAVLGAAAFILLQSLVSSYTERWMLILGLTFILFVLFAPGGIVGALRGRVGLRA